MRRALVVGIDYYERLSQLHGCVNDAHRVQAALHVHADGSPNFEVELLTATSEDISVSRDELREGAEKLFANAEEIEVALFYFAGHGDIDIAGGSLYTTEVKKRGGGLNLHDVLAFANASKAANRIIILDSCHSGAAGEPTPTKLAELARGVTILTASQEDQYAEEATEGDGPVGGLFTNLMIEALSGGAADLLGRVTPGSVYARIDQSLGSWGQRPVFKTNVARFVVLRQVSPAIPLNELRKIANFFPKRGFTFQLDPTFEPERDQANADELPPPDETNCAIFAILQKFNRNGLVDPTGANSMYYAAINSQGCRLTALGEHYRRLAAKNHLANL